MLELFEAVLHRLLDDSAVPCLLRPVFFLGIRGASSWSAWGRLAGAAQKQFSRMIEECVVYPVV